MRGCIYTSVQSPLYCELRNYDVAPLSATSIVPIPVNLVASIVPELGGSLLPVLVETSERVTDVLMIDTVGGVRGRVDI
jgi:hypothetical protein